MKSAILLFSILPFSFSSKAAFAAQIVMPFNACSLVKQFSKLKSTKNVEVIYTKIEDVYKTDIAGSVLTYKSKVIVV
jgi:hypothetical protein